MRSKVGKEIPVEDRFEAPTLWGTTSFIADELTRVDAEVSDLVSEIDPIKNTIHVLKSQFEDSGDVKDAMDKLVKIVAVMMTRLQALSPEIALMRCDLEELKVSFRKTRSDSVNSGYRVGGGVDLKATSGSPMTAVNELMSLVCDDDSMLGGNDVLSCVTPTKKAGTGVAAVTHDSSDTRGSDSVLVKQLVQDVRALKSASAGTSIKFANLGFANIHECSTWIETHFSGLRYGLIMDPLLMLERIYGDDEVDAMSLMKTLESRLKLKIETGAEASALNALRHSRPRIFHKGRPTMVNLPNKSRLNLLASHGEWKSGGEGVKAFIVQKMNILHATISADIAFEFGRDVSNATAQMVATMSLTATITFITQLLGMVDTMYERLFSFSKFTSDQAWSLTTQVLDRVMADLYAPKDGIGESLTTRSPLSICAHLMWGTFRTHDVMSAYVLHNFRRPSCHFDRIREILGNQLRFG
jgi:hypothetical protein